MTVYVTGDAENQGQGHGDPRPGAMRAGGEAGRPPLVTTSISQQNRLELYRHALKLKRPGTGNQAAIPPDRTGSTLCGFSDKSRSGLRFLAENSARPLVSQFGLTYHDQWPTNGRICKAHLNTWLVAVRRILPGVGYLWLLEFQKRDAPHFHVFLTVPPDEQTRLRLAAAWCRITSPGDPAALRFHQDQRNWIAWDMTTANYLCKYLDKDAQKAIPDGYSSFGRFWGNSRCLKPLPTHTIPLDDVDHLQQIDHETGEVYGGSTTVLRWLGRLAEKQTRGYSRFRLRAPRGSYSIRNGAAAFHRIAAYFDSLPCKGSPF